MCGIAGFSLSPSDNINPTHLATHLLLNIESRGRDATGAAYFEDGQSFIQKADIPATEYVEYLDLNPDVTNCILHTRWASQGEPSNNNNNHPINVGGIIGVHNGVLFNDNEIFSSIRNITGENKRIAEVDSEAIFSLLRYSPDKVTESLGLIDGSAAIAWFDTFGDPDLMHLSRVSSSPLVFAFTEAGSFIFASTAKAITDSMNMLGMDPVGGPYNLDEGVYLRVRNGMVVTQTRYETMDRRYALTDTEKHALNLA